MVIGAMVAKKGVPDRDNLARSSLAQASDSIFIVEDESKGYWTVPEWPFRQRYLDYMIEQGAKWGVSIDSDERIFNPVALYAKMMLDPEGVSCFRLLIYDIWDTEDGQTLCRRLDHVMGRPQYQTRAWRVRPGQIIERVHMQTSFGPNGIMHEGKSIDIPPEHCCIVHCGYRSPGVRLWKRERWKEVDPKGRLLGGDLDAFFSDRFTEPIPDFLKSYIPERAQCL